MKQFYILIVSLLLFSFKANGQVTLSQTTDDTFDSDASGGCITDTSVTFDNEYFRAFDLNALGYSHFEVTSIDFGINLVANESEGFAVEAVIYGTTSFPSGTLTEIQSVSVPLTSSDTGTIKTVPISANLDATTYPIMVVAIKVPNEVGQGHSTQFFIGANKNGQTAPSYISSSSCGANTPITIASLGFTSNVIIKVTGNETTANLSVNENTIEGFKLYPNPVKDTLFLNAQAPIEEISIYNVVGQRVLQVVPNVLNTSILLKDLEAGTYIVKVKVGDKTTTHKVIKE